MPPLTAVEPSHISACWLSAGDLPALQSAGTGAS
jgi:hypothetical protein